MAGKRQTKINAPFGWCYTDILNDPNLSLKAKGLWTFIQSKPEGWRFSERRIAQQTLDGLASVRSGLQELMDAGLLKRYIEKDANGLVIGSVYELLPPKSCAQACVEDDFNDFDDQDDNESVSRDKTAENGLKTAQNANTDSTSCGSTTTDEIKFTSLPSAEPPYKRTASDEDYASAADLARDLAEAIRGNYPEHRIAPIAVRLWQTEFVKMWSQDMREWDEIGEVLDWAAGDAFWKSVIWDAKSLRKNYDKILAQMKREDDMKMEVINLNTWEQKRKEQKQ